LLGLGLVSLLRRALLLRRRGLGVVGTARSSERRLVAGLLVDRLCLRAEGSLDTGQALELLPVAGDLEEGDDRFRRLGADAEPVLCPFGVDLDHARLRLGPVAADEFDGPAAAPGAGVGDDDAVERFTDLAHAGKF